MMGRQVEVSFPPKRIVSVVPSQTELLHEFGLEKEVIGLTKFCVHPEAWFRSKQRIGGTKKLHLDKIIALRPDLIIANKEENTREEIEFLSQHLPVWISDISTVAEGLDMILQVGMLTDRPQLAADLKDRISSSFRQLETAQNKVSVAYFIWRNPWMTVGTDTFIHDMLCTAGWQNVYSATTRYPETSLDELEVLNPELVLLSSEPYPFAEHHIAEIRSRLPKAKILLVDGELFSWYGSRMQYAADYLKELQQVISHTSG
jgi:ABC-type Fe3+-hydroxamate transport system substrate-binding protein